MLITEEQYSFEIIFCNIIKVFNVAFDTFNGSLLNKSISFLLKNILLNPNFTVV